ncbi:hypothetical protein [Amycolatopsis saalfeldensis]|uniref:Ig-like domain (Group 3) n=1 Tax=Amycolatopsis saalfeldensis TaxID=394193 RepID=A0A1H8YKG5_9PSEU|nr:hypothetical protein [Amycolatopsis saalfeldensis]SEP51888.1 hypothetical protein SAMN04489732_117206 [Amycolatopsis saalfeldensis]
MKRIVVFSTVLGAGLLMAAPAFAAGSTTTPTTPTTPTAPPTSATGTPTSSPTETAPSDDSAGVPKAFLRLLPAAGRPGAHIAVRVGCEAGYIEKLSSPVLDFGKLTAGPQNDPSVAPVSKGTATVKKNAKPGTYTASYECGGAKITSKFTVLPAKQVVKVPAGAPQTGGSDGYVVD